MILQVFLNSHQIFNIQNGWPEPIGNKNIGKTIEVMVFCFPKIIDINEI